MRTLTKIDKSFLFLFAVSLLLSLLYCPPVDMFFDDKEIFRYIGRLIAHGGVPYRDVFDHKPPLIFFLNYFGYLLGPWGLWLIDTTLVMLASLVFFGLCRRHRLPWPWLLPLLFNLLLRNNMVSLGIGMTREYTAIFLVLFFCLLSGTSKYRYFWMGLLAAATFFMQQDQFLTLLPFLLYALFIGFPSVDGRNWLLTAAGALALTLPVLFYFWINHSLSFFWEDAFQFNRSWYTEKIPFSVNYRATKEGLERSACLMPLILATSLGVSALFLRNKKKLLIAAALLGVLFSFVTEYLSGKLVTGYPFYYYFQPLSAALPVLVFIVWANTDEPFLRESRSQLLYGFLLCCLPLYNAIQHATHLPRHDLVSKLPEYQYLRSQRLSGHDLYVFGDNAWVYAYNEFDLFAPSRWIYHHFWAWYPQWDAGHQLLGSIENDLLKSRTTWIVNYADDSFFKSDSARVIWLSFLNKYYRPVTVPGSTRQLLWQLK